jgi:hypothetical protein
MSYTLTVRVAHAWLWVRYGLRPRTTTDSTGQRWTRLESNRALSPADVRAASRFLMAATTLGREPVSPPPGRPENGPRWDTLGPGHAAQDCPICRGRSGESVAMAVAVLALSLLVGGLLVGWWTP